MFLLQVKEFVYDYTDCLSQENPAKTCAEILENDILKQTSCTCMLPVNLTETFDVNFHASFFIARLELTFLFVQGDVYIYYGLSNFYQNHRRYVKSRDDHQLLGALGEASNECDPFARYAPDPSNSTAIKSVVPCGAIANSLFNGNFLLYRNSLSLI